MEVNRLLGDELAYELLIRGLPVPDTVMEKRTILRGALRMEREGMTKPLEMCTFLDPTDELASCQSKVDELSNDIQNFNMQNKINEYKRISSRLCHLRLRVSRITKGTEEMERRKEDLLIRIMGDMETVGNLMDEHENKSRLGVSGGNVLDEEYQIEGSIMDERIPLIPELSSTKAVRETVNSVLQRPPNAGLSPFLRDAGDLMQGLQEVRASVRDNNFHFADMMSGLDQGTESRQNRHHTNIPEMLRRNSTKEDEPPGARLKSPMECQSCTLPDVMDGMEKKLRYLNLPSNPVPNYYSDISRWKLQFDGESSVTNFLERLDELRISRGVTHDQLLRSACELFTKDALLWYRTHHFTSWNDLIRQLKEDFQPYDYEYELWEEIRKRTQGTREKVIVFIASMENLFNRLGVAKPVEKARVKMIQRNLLPYIQSQLALQTIHTISDLTRFARSIEETALRTEKFCPPPTNYKYLLEPDLAYRKPSSGIPSTRVSSVEVSKETEDAHTQVSSSGLSVDGRQVLAVCWNCNEKGHRFRKCTKPKMLFCYYCGKKNITARDCECQKNVRRGQK